jgi:hypothetical protein
MTVVQQQAPKASHVDRPELAETFADSIHNMVWDGQTLRIEFCVTRYPDGPASPGAEARRFPAARLVLTAPVATDLFNRLQQMIQALAKAAAVASAQQPQQ